MRQWCWEWWLTKEEDEVGNGRESGLTYFIYVQPQQCKPVSKWLFKRRCNRFKWKWQPMLLVLVLALQGIPKLSTLFQIHLCTWTKKKYEMIICFSFCFCYQGSFQGHIFLNNNAKWARYFGISRVTPVRYESRVIYQTHSPIWSLYTKLGSKPDTVALLDFYTSEGYLIFPSPQAQTETC